MTSRQLKQEDDHLSVENVPQPLIEAIVVHEILRTLGVPAKDIYLDLLHLPEVRVVVVLDGKRFSIVAHKSWLESGSVGPAILHLRWARAVSSWNAGCNDPNSGWQQAIESSNMRRAAVDIIANLVINGVRLPKAST